MTVSFDKDAILGLRRLRVNRIMGNGLFLPEIPLKRVTPPLHLLTAFVSTARQSTISGAARELHLTQGAVSKKIKELESLLGVALFDRAHGRLGLSPAGQSYLKKLAPALEDLEAATLGVMSLRGRGGVLNLMTTPTFGAKWLIPRLPAFQSQHPDVFLNFMPYVRASGPDSADLDCAFRYGEGNWPGEVSHFIQGRAFVVIASPDLAADLRLRKKSDVRKHVLLQHPMEPTAWLRWCEVNRVDHTNPLGGPKLDQINSIVRAVMAGLGIGLVPLCLVEDDIQNGMVVSPFADVLALEAGYFLTYPEGKRDMPALAAFRDWALSQA
jgi:LysR family transcriptional regulator, glycine cleavage system transcriptional activator